ncbi:bifunctional 2-polyprenyl-6-hydroxyphenol methylase/3-demethylubiquinol 3-O-methyltransferase UbiG [Candidatus Chloroploca sp. Khr17]|uniref:class I SAM-dependent methyltransferase n=1 Tax=Candidatus Chloroploca sp. Khr17 TaxID=2496869 RepID=UPI00101BFF2C|nr:class I SAM-dependent methyltransferase [Candidatus Chloroploca sp. Khr17]
MSIGQNNSIAAFYEFADSSRHSSTSDKRRVHSLLTLLEPGQSDSFLDIGCYDGTKTAMIAGYLRSEIVYGVDFLRERLQQAMARGISAINVDLNATTPLPFNDRTFDFIFVGDVIEHLFSPDYLLQEISRLLRPGGYAVLTTPNLASWRNRIVLLFGWQPFMTEVSTNYRVGNPYALDGVPSGHIRIFSPRAMRELPEKYGLRVECLGGQILSSAPQGIVGHLSQWVDYAVYAAYPTLCDELVVKLRR